jgi:NAD(P)H-dependent FMN reductase
VLKNAFDYIYHEWVRKPIVFIGYGNVGGARAIEQLRLVAVELQMAPIKQALHLSLPAIIAHYQGGDVEAELNQLGAPADAMIADLLWWTDALKQARAR